MNPASLSTQHAFSSFHRSLVVGTRGSLLAQWQTNYVLAALKQIAPEIEIETRIIKTSGDKDQTRTLAELGGLGAFTKEIENALLSHEIDFAVHSLKDLPTELSVGLALAAITERADPRDCVVSRHHLSLMQLPPGARIGTSSARRSAQVRALRPDAQIIPLRGNVDTRLRKAQTEAYDAIVIAAAGIIRLGHAGEITEYLARDTFFPDPGQGALAIEIRADDAELASLIAHLDHAPTRMAVTAERAFLRALGGGCRLPIGAYAEMRGGQLHLDALIASDDGTDITHGESAGDPLAAEELGTKLAARLSAIHESPLRGKRILVTRAPEQAQSLADKVRALGGEPVEFPTIYFAPVEDYTGLDHSLGRIAEFDWVVFTSVNGVRATADRLRVLGIEPGALSAPKIAAIGPATAAALKTMGVHVDFIPSKFLGEQIALELPIERGQCALLLRADIASDVLARGLKARGITVTNIPAYRTIMPPMSNIDLGGIDAVTFTSSSTVRNFVALMKGNRLDHAAVICIGPVTAETARDMGLRVDAIATEYTTDGLVNALVTHYRGK